MITKEDIFAQGSDKRDSDNVNTFRNGLVPNTVARAEEVNMAGFMADRDLYVVCQEITNLMRNYGIQPNNSYASGQQNQLTTLFSSIISSGLFLTGVYQPTFTNAPTQSGNQITFPEMDVVFNTGVFYGRTAASQKKAHISATNVSATSAWATGVHFIYAKLPSQTSANAVIDHQTEPISAADGASKCMLGSVFVINGIMQANSWKFQPWLQETSVDTRQSPTAYTKGGFVSASGNAGQLQMGSVEIRDEGINFGANQLSPNIITIPAKNPFTYKFLHPGYNPASSDLTTLDTTHIYNMTSGTWDNISSIVSATNPKYMVMVPCVTPAGQTLMIPAMSYKSGATYEQLFDTQEAAVNSIFSLPYALGNTAKRAIYLGQSLVVKVGATDLRDPLNLMSVGMVPQALAGFSSASGQAGGGITTYRPMPSITWSGYTNIVAQNNATNVIIDPRTQVTVSMPATSSSVLNQLEIQYTAQGGYLSFSTNINWWSGVAPVFSSGTTYLIICEYINGQWYGGVLGK